MPALQALLPIEDAEQYGRQHEHEHEQHGHTDGCDCRREHHHGDAHQHCDHGHSADEHAPHPAAPPQAAAFKIEVSEHEGALAASCLYAKLGSATTVEGQLAAQMERLATDIASAGGVVGHIKATVQGGSYRSMLSNTGTTTNIAVHDDPFCRIEFVAIIIGVSERELRGMISSILAI